MAEAWTRPDDDGSKDGEGRTRPFDRQALQATLADAVRTASDAETLAAPPNKPLRGPTASSPVISAPTDAEQDAVVPPRPQPARSVNPFSRGAAASADPVPAPPPAAPTPKRPTSLLGGGTPTSVASNQASSLGAGGLGSGGGLSGGGLGSPGTVGSGGLRSPGSGNLGPINLGGDNRVTGDLSGGRSAAALAPAPAEQPTIALRRRQPVEPAPSARSGESATAAAPSQTAPASAPARAAVSIEGWTPTDDDILPRRVMKRSFRRR